jgi:hypothetical protein
MIGAASRDDHAIVDPTDLGDYHSHGILDPGRRFCVLVAPMSQRYDPAVGLRHRSVVARTVANAPLRGLHALESGAAERGGLDHHYPAIEGLFIHPFADAAVMVGNGTIGLEILADAPEAAGSRAASRPQCARSGPASGSTPRRLKPRRHSPRRWRRRRRSPSRRPRASWTGSAAGTCSPTCGRWPRTCSRGRSSPRWPRSLRRFGCSRNAIASSPRVRARRPSRRPSTEPSMRRPWCASSAAATSTAKPSPRSSTAR